MDSHPAMLGKKNMMVDLIINIASGTLTLLYVIAFLTGLAIILKKRPVFFKTTFIT